MAVERCICHNIQFKKILEIAEQNGFTTVEELQERGICCTNCKLCVPYIKVSLQTGANRFQPDFFQKKKKGFMNLFYVHPSDINLPRLILRGQEARHVTKVLRYREGDKVFATDGRGNLYETEMNRTGRDLVELQVTESRFEEPEKPWLTICIGLLKKRDRLEFAVEKAVELGVNEIIIFKGGHSQKDNVRLDRLEATIISAMKQSLRLYLPEVSVEASLEEALGTQTGGCTSVIVADETTDNSRLNNHQKEKIFLVVGPEGGFSKEERVLLNNLNPQFYSLGSKRLRTETAAILMADHFRK